MVKLTVEVLTARDLLPTDDHGSPSPFVEVDFDGYRQRTQTKTRDLYPSWNEKLVFDIQNPRTLHKSIIQVILYDDRCANHHKDFLGCVQISGTSVSLLESEAAVQRYPLCNRGFFSHGRGDISLRIYVVRAQHYGNQQQRHRLNTNKAPKLEEISDQGYNVYQGGDKEIGEDTEIMNFHSAGTRAGAESATKVERGRNFMNAGTANEEEKLSVNRLFVKVVKARDLPVTGNLGPYVEVKFREHKGVTKHIAKNEPLVWNEVFAFNSNGLERNLVEVVVKDFGTDIFVGSIVVFDTAPFRFQGESPMTPQWHRLKNREGDTVTGEIMIAVWMGAQSNNTFPADSHDIIAHQNLTNTSPSVYFSPTLYYLRVGVIEARHLAPSHKNQPPEFGIQIKLRNQVLRTRTSKVLDGNPVWNEDMILLASEPFDDSLNINAVEGYARQQIIGWAILPLGGIPQRFDSTEHVQARWFNLNGITSNRVGNEKKQGKILLKLSLETGYHVSDCHQGDFQPTARHLKKDKIGGLEIAILGAQGLPPMKKQRDGRATTNAYCVAKYGNKWVRTTTSINSQDPCWNEHYDWEVYDPCTVIVIGVFDDGNVSGSRKDQRISKVLIPLQTLEMNRTYTQNYPLLALHPSGLKNHGTLQVAVRFTGLSWPNIVSIYTKPLLPKMNYLQPLSVVQLEFLRYKAVERVAACLSNAEPPLKKEIVEYMLDTGSHVWSMRKQKANFDRLITIVSGITTMFRWFGEIRQWNNPLKTIFIHVLYLVFVWYPKLILPGFFLSLSMMGMWNYKFRPRNPPCQDARLSRADITGPDDLDEEFDTFPTSQRGGILNRRYDRLRSIAGRYQTVVGDIATVGERAMAILTCSDLRATSFFTALAFICVVFIYMASFKVVATLMGLYCLRHPLLRSKNPSILVNLFNRLPTKMDVLLLT